MSLLKTNELQKPRPFSCKVAGQRPMTSSLRMTGPRLFSNLLQIQQLPQPSRLGAADGDFGLLAVVHLQLVRALEPGDDFLDAVDVDEIRAVDAPEDVRIKVALELLDGAEVGLALEVAGDNADHPVLDAGVNDVIGVYQVEAPAALDQQLVRLSRRQGLALFNHLHQAVQLLVG